MYVPLLGKVGLDMDLCIVILGVYYETSVQLDLPLCIVVLEMQSGIREKGVVEKDEDKQ